MSLAYFQKRPSLAVGGISRCPDYRHLSLASASSSRGTSEDWVQQAGGLSIDSPIFPPLDRDDRSALQDKTPEGDVDMVGFDSFALTMVF